jgi:lysophospholipase L1-like esterase
MKTIMAAQIASAAALVWMTAAGAHADHTQTTTPGGRWRTAWATSQQTTGTSPISNTTLRLIARVTIAGDAVRIRLENAYGKTPLRVGAAQVGLRSRGAAIASGSSRPVTFAGSASVTIAPGGSVRSDPVAMRVVAHQDLAISLHIPDTDVYPSQHTGALTTSYVAAAGSGDVSATESSDAFKETITTMPWLKAIDVQSTTAAGTIVAFGDSITDGTCATLDAHDRWEDWLAIRLALDDDRQGRRNAQKAIVNEGIGGNTVTREGLQPPPDSTPGIERLDRDVLSHEGVTDVILFMGTNDIRRGASAAQVTDGMSAIAARVQARGLRIFAATIIPRHNVPPTATNSGWNDEKTAIRREVNQWIRAHKGFTRVIDFDAAVRDPANHDLIAPPFNCDGIHPTPRGYFEMGRSIPLNLLNR